MEATEEIRIPGFIDLQVNGYIGVDYSSPELTEEELVVSVRALRKQGTAGMLVTFISCPPDVLERNAALVLSAVRVPEVAAMVLGFHAEGPFIAPEDGQRGAHQREHVLPGDERLLERMIRWCDGRLRLLTVAAGVPGVEPVIRRAVQSGVVVSLGHHNASLREIEAAVAAGATMHTHLGNGIANRLDRTDNSIFHVLANDLIVPMLITDGHHVPASFIRTVWKVKGPDRLVVVSDQSPVAGLPPGEYRTLGNRVRLEPGGRLHNPDGNHLAGSASTLAECVTHLAGLRIATAGELVSVAFENPLRAIGLDRSAVAAGPGVVVRVGGVEVLP